MKPQYVSFQSGLPLYPKAPALIRTLASTGLAFEMEPGIDPRLTQALLQEVPWSTTMKDPETGRNALLTLLTGFPSFMEKGGSCQQAVEVGRRMAVPVAFFGEPTG